MFKIIPEKQNDLERIKITNNKEYISIIPELGANINEIVLKKGNKIYSILDGRDSKEGFGGSDIYNSAKLFPFPNRVKNGIYEFEGKTYQLPINWPQEEHAIHGFVCDKVFNLIHSEEAEEYANTTLSYKYDGTQAGYPFPFQMNVTYRLDADEFSCVTELMNTGENSMPISDGWHPYFSFHKKVDNLYLQIPKADIVCVDKLIPNGEKKPYSYFTELEQIKSEKFDNCFLMKNDVEKHYTKIYDPDEQTTIILWQDSKYKYLQVYIPPDRESIALEPMTANVNSFNNKEGLIILKAGEKDKLSYGVQLR